MNDRFLNAVSISRVARAQCAPGFRARVLHAFPRALDLLVLGSEEPPGAVVALVDPTVGDGPLNVVVSASAPFAGVPAGTEVRGDGRRLHVDGLVVDLSGARTWDPRWPWERRSSQISDVSGQRAVDGHAAPDRYQPSAVSQWPGWSLDLGHMTRIVQKAAADLQDALCTGDRHGLAEAAASLAGLGPGLTPAGDDFLAGVMWGLRFAWPDAWAVGALCDVIVAAAAPRTTPLSAALLQAAGAGLADAHWHALFDALDRGEDATVALRAVLDQGATSGADAWAGFQIPNSKFQIPNSNLQCTSLPT